MNNVRFKLNNLAFLTLTVFLTVASVMVTYVQSAQAVPLAPVTYSADTSVVLSNGDSLTIVSGSTADSVTVNATANTISVTTTGSEAFTLKSSNNKALTNNGGYNQCTLVNSIPQITVNSPATVVFSPTAVDCSGGVTYTPGSGGGGGGGGGGGASTPVASVISVTSPAANVSLTVGASQSIKWSVTGSDISKVEIDYAADGSTYTQVAKDLSPSAGSYAWTVPSTATSTAMLKLVGYNSSSEVVSTSTVAFKVVAAASSTPAPTTTPTTQPATSTPSAGTSAPAEQPSSQAAPVAVLIHDPSKFDELLSALGVSSKPEDFAKYKPLVASDALAFKVGITADQQTTIANFITYGASSETVKLGAGERRAEIRDYFETVGRSDINWDDIQRMTTGQKLVQRNLPKEQAQATRVLANFKLMVGHAPNFKDPKEDLAWNTMMYRIRFSRDLKAEQEGILKFKKIYKHAPVSPLEWSIVRALGYALK